MEFWHLYLNLLSNLHRRVARRIEQELERFASALEEWICTLDQRHDRTGWRSAFAGFIAEWTAEGFTVEPASITALETWIASWAGEDRPVKEPTVRPHVVTVVPNVSGPLEPKNRLEAVEDRGKRVFGQKFFVMASRFRFDTQREVKRFGHLHLTAHEEAEFEAYAYECRWCVQLGLPLPLEPMSFFNKREAYKRQSEAMGIITAAPYKSDEQLRREQRERMIARPQGHTTNEVEQAYAERAEETRNRMASEGSFLGNVVRNTLDPSAPGNMNEWLPAIAGLAGSGAAGVCSVADSAVAGSTNRGNWSAKNSRQ